MMKVTVVLLLVCLAGLAVAQQARGMTGLSGLSGMGAMAAASGNSNLRNMLALQMLSRGGSGRMPPGLQMLMLAQGMIDTPMEMMACRTNMLLCHMMVNRR